MPCTNHPSHHPSDACTHPCSPHSQMHPNLKCKPCMNRMYNMSNSMLLCTGSASYTEDMAIEEKAAVGSASQPVSYTHLTLPTIYSV